MIIILSLARSSERIFNPICYTGIAYMSKRIILIAFRGEDIWLMGLWSDYTSARVFTVKTVFCYYNLGSLIIRHYYLNNYLHASQKISLSLGPSHVLQIQNRNIYCKTYITRFTLHGLNKYKSSASLNKLNKYLRQNYKIIAVRYRL